MRSQAGVPGGRTGQRGPWGWVGQTGVRGTDRLLASRRSCSAPQAGTAPAGGGQRGARWGSPSRTLRPAWPLWSAPGFLLCRRRDAATSCQSSQDDMGPSEYLGAGLISATVTCNQGQEFREDTVRDGVSAQTQEQSHHSEPREGLALACLGGNKLPVFRRGQVIVSSRQTGAWRFSQREVTEHS